MTLAGLIAQKYAPPEWAVFFEVSNSTGSAVRRRADAVALGVWPSRGHTLVGFEFKEVRRDWLREKKNPEKAEAVASHCDAWWVVASAADIVKVEELPEPWGLYVANKDRSRLLTAKPCQPFPDRDPRTMHRSFVAAMLRKVNETTVPKVELSRLIAEGVQAATATLRDGRELQILRRDLEAKEQILQTFKTITGVDLEGWRGPTRIAQAVDAVLHMEGWRQDLSLAKARLEQAAQGIARAIEAWPLERASEKEREPS